eukprot:COSAG05_NODE_32_length_28165_cov_450.666714_15_plen_84_part_00
MKNKNYFAYLYRGAPIQSSTLHETHAREPSIGLKLLCSMIDALYCRSTAVLLAMHVLVWLYVVAVLCTRTWSQEQVGRTVIVL